LTYTEIWQSLETSASNLAGGHVRRRVKPQSVCSLFLAVAKPSNQHMLQIRLVELSATVAANLPSARGLDVVVIRSKNEQTGFTIQLVLREQRFDSVFDALIHDVIEVVAHAQSESAAFAAFVSRLQHWQKFLEQVGPDGLSREAQQGLYGELWFLRKRLIPLVGLYPALLAWAGPGGAHQDFLLQSCAVEVKTTGMKEPQQLIIQSERQLDETGLAALFLLHLSIDAREGVGESLVMMINSLRQLLKADTAALELYEDRLLEAGFLQSQSSQYESTRYNIRHTYLYQVRDSFPRIIGTDLKPGVGAVRYSISAAECRYFAVTEDELKFRLTGLNYGK
jgi:hypothetical protein